MHVEVLTAVGERGIRIPPNVGRGWCYEAGGRARYRFYIPYDGEYTLWAYCLWAGACSNAIYTQVDDGPRVILGNDSVYGTWHWVRSVRWQLSQGTHRLVLSNHSDGIALQQVMLLSDPHEHPAGGLEAQYDIFSDTFDGCDGGNIVAWTFVPQSWRVSQVLAANQQRWLESTTNVADEYAFAVVGSSVWQDYSISARMRISGLGWVGICFDWSGPGDYTVLEWPSVPSTGFGPTTVRLIRKENGRQWLLGECKARIPADRWLAVDTDVRQGKLELRVDGQPSDPIDFPGRKGGKGGFVVRGAALAVDDVHICQIGNASGRLASDVTTVGEVWCHAHD